MRRCKHDWVRILNIRKNKFWYMIFIFGSEFERKEKYICLKCGKERR